MKFTLPIFCEYEIYKYIHLNEQMLRCLNNRFTENKNKLNDKWIKDIFGTMCKIHYTDSSFIFSSDKQNFIE